MSDLSNGSMKKVIIEELGTGIAIGRGYGAQVTAKAVQQDYAQPAAMSLPQAASSMAELDAFITNSSISDETKQYAREALHGKLVGELDKGESANVAVVKELLEVITGGVPDIRDHLRSFIDNYDGVSKTIRLVTNKLLD